MTEFSTPQFLPVTMLGAVQIAGRLKSVTAEIVSNLLAYTVKTAKSSEKFITNVGRDN